MNNVSWAPHALHGFLHVLPWKFESFASNEKEAVLTLSRDFYGDANAYPFTYKVTNIYTFNGKSFTVKSIVKNTYHETLPYAQGFHPYFMLGKKVNALTLSMPASHKALLDSADIPTGELEAETRFTGNTPIAETFINDYFAFDAESSDRVSVILKDPETGNQIDVWQKTGKDLWRGIQIYTPPDRESIALEPMSSAPDVLNHHRELIEIIPNASIELLWGAEFGISVR